MENTALMQFEKSNKEIDGLDLDHLKNPEEFKAFAIWLSMPPLMRKPPRDKQGNAPTIEDFCAQMGIDDDEVISLVKIRTMTEFSEKYGISQNTLTAWRKEIKRQDIMHDIRVWANELNSNVVFALYNKAIRGGLPEHYKLWFQVIAGWSEKIRVDKRVIKAVEIRIVNPTPEEPAATPQ